MPGRRRITIHLALLLIAWGIIIYLFVDLVEPANKHVAIVFVVVFVPLLAYMTLQQLWYDFIRAPGTLGFGTWWVSLVGYRVDLPPGRSVFAVNHSLEQLPLGWPWYCGERTLPGVDPDTAGTVQELIRARPVTIWFLREKDMMQAVAHLRDAA